MIVLGAVVLFFGRAFFTYTIFTLGFIVGFITTLVLFVMTNVLSQMLETDYSSDSLAIYFWLKILVSLVIGVFLGFILTQMQLIAAGLLGCYLGVFVGFAFYALCFSWSHSTALAICIYILFAILGAYMTFKAYHIIIIISTSLIGSYAITKGITLCITDFPTEVQLWKAFQSDDSTGVFKW